jgi:tetratricopeptide (TPR) repeat protein
MARELEDAAATDLIAGLRALALGDSVKAIARLEKLTKDPVAQIALARAQAKQGNHTKAITTLRKAVELDAGSTRSRVALAQILIAAGHDTEAVATLEAVVEARPTQPALLAAAGEAFLTVGLPGHAASLLKQALKHTAGSVAVQLLAGRVALANQRTADARNHFDELLRREPRNAEALVELGRLDAAEGNGAKARQRFASALKQRPKDPDLLVLLARGHAQTGDYRKAMASGMQAVKLLRQSGQTARAYEVMVELGRVAARGDPWAKTRAEELFFEATKPQNAPAAPFFELGRLHKQKNDPARAVWCFRQALERDPQLADAYLEMGLVMRAKPQWRKEAKKALRHYLQLRPQAKDAAKIKAIVDRMR